MPLIAFTCEIRQTTLSAHATCDVVRTIFPIAGEPSTTRVHGEYFTVIVRLMNQRRLIGVKDEVARKVFVTNDREARDLILCAYLREVS